MKNRFKISGRIFFSLLLCLINSSVLFGQSIFTNPITAADPSLSNPFTTGQVVDANITVSGIGRGPGIAASAALNRYSASSWNTLAIDLTAYFEFVITPTSPCEIDFASFVYTGTASGTGPTSFVFRSSVDGFTANIGAPTAFGTTISLAAAAYQNITTAITFRFYGFGASASTGTYSINDFTFNGTVSCGCSGPVAEPTTETTADSSSPGCISSAINWTASTTADNVIVVISTGAITDVPVDGTNYTANTTFGSGEELVLADGQFVVYNGTGTSVNISGLTPGTNYNYAIFGYDGVVINCEENYLTGGNFGSFATPVCSNAQITTIMVNSCSGASEGTDELIIIENGSEPVSIDDIVITLPNTTWCNAGCGTNTIGNNTTYLNDMNTMAGCSPDLFVYSDPIPAGATIIIFTGNPPTTVLDYSSNCGAPGAPMYVLFLNNSSITGNYANSGATPKTTTIDFGNGQTDVVTYLPDDVDAVDGGSVLFDDAGNPGYYTSLDCVYPLSIRLISFTGYNSDGKNILNWSSASESNSDKYEIQRSVNGIDFEIIGVINVDVDSDSESDYSFSDDQPGDAYLYYYRLALIDQNYAITYSEIVTVVCDEAMVVFSDDKLNVTINTKTAKDYTVNIYSLDGNLVSTSQVSGDSQIPFNHSGLFIVEIPELRFRLKIVCF